MIRLHQSFGVHTGRVAEFDQESVSIGRMPDSDLAFHPEGDLDASGRHAELRRTDGAWKVVDIGSRNGTFLNGERVSEALLKDGDELEFGEGGPRLRVELVEGEGAPEPIAGDPAERISRAEVLPTERPPARTTGSVPPPDPAAEEQLREALLATRHGEMDGPYEAPLAQVRRLRGALFVVTLLLIVVLGAIGLQIFE